MLPGLEAPKEYVDGRVSIKQKDFVGDQAMNGIIAYIHKWWVRCASDEKISFAEGLPRKCCAKLR